MDDMGKLIQLGRWAKNLRVDEVLFQSVDSDGKPIEDTEHVVTIVYNLENISGEEVMEQMNNGMYETDPRILLASPEQIKNIFPPLHWQENEQDDALYWEPDGDGWRCSGCGFSTRVPVSKYRFCPNCGGLMQDKEREE